MYFKGGTLYPDFKWRIQLPNTLKKDMSFIQHAPCLCHQGDLWKARVTSLKPHELCIGRAGISCRDCVNLHWTQELRDSVSFIKHHAVKKKSGLLCQPYCPSIGTIPGQTQTDSCHQNNLLPSCCIFCHCSHYKVVPLCPASQILPLSALSVVFLPTPLHQLALGRFAVAP